MRHSILRLWTRQVGSPFLCLFFIVLIIQGTFGAVKICEKYDEGKSFKCIKDIVGMSGDNFGRVGIINKSQQCASIRFTKQEWSKPCKMTSGENMAPTLQRVFPGEVLRYGDFQQDMVLDYIQLQSCGELRILECYCGKELVRCPDYLFVATYKRGEHAMLLETFEASQKYKFEPASDC